MSEARFASLNPALLARKGGAKPAMRPQLAPLPQDPAALGAIAEDQLEDLGWNDMGSDDDPAPGNGGADVVSITGKAANEDVGAVASPVVRRQQKNLSERVLADAALPAADGAKPKKAKAGARKGKRAAFTLRLDPERHLRLRLATTMKGVSAQALVTEALDAMLGQIEELDALVERMKRD